jgi:UDP-glucose 4-epimerase
VGRILIFGGAGFIGTNLVELLTKDKSSEVYVFDNLSMGSQLHNLGLEVDFIQSDMTCLPDVTSALKEIRPNKIFHFAANSDIRASTANPRLDILNTLQTTTTLTQALKLYPVQDLVFSSSSAVYGLSSKKLSEEDPCLPISSYGWMKLASEEVLKQAQMQGDVHRLLIVRFPNVTGKWQTHGVVHDLVRKILLNKMELQVLGNGTQDKPYVLASELCLNLIRILESNWTGELTLNLSPPSKTKVSEIAEIVVEELGLNTRITFGDGPNGWVGDVPSYELDTSRSQQVSDMIVFSESNHAIRESVKFAFQQFGL